MGLMSSLINLINREQTKRSILEALYISEYNPGLNEQIRSRKLKLFPNGMTYVFSDY